MPGKFQYRQRLRTILSIFLNEEKIVIKEKILCLEKSLGVNNNFVNQTQIINYSRIGLRKIITLKLTLNFFLKFSS